MTAAIDFTPQRIGVFRALMLGDMLCAVPALRAVRAAWPRADIALIGLPWARGFARRLPSLVDRFIEFPGYPGLPETEPDLGALPGFLLEMQRQRLDLLIQMHGAGTVTNPLMACFGARHVAGFVEPKGYCAEPRLHVAWPAAGHEIERLLTLTDHLGMPRRGTALEFPVTAHDRVELAALWPGSARPYACVHPGAQLASRRWPPERFAQVADRLAAQGLQVVLTGTQGEVDLVGRVRSAMQAPAVNLAGRTTLWTLGALIGNARVLVSNDTGVSHIAAALGTPSVIVSCGADVSRWAPLDADLHRVLWQPMPCRPCAHRDCPYDHGCAKAVSVQAANEETIRMLGRQASRLPV